MSAASIDAIAAMAARLIVEEGMEYGTAKRRAARALGYEGTRRDQLPDNNRIEDEVRDYIGLFCADAQPQELAELRRIAALWMERLTAFRPHLTGAVWRGTATRLNNLHIELYCDDSKAAELALIDAHVDYEVGSRSGPRGEAIDVLSIAHASRELGESITLHFSILDHDDLRGALKPDARGRTWRGDAAALRHLMEAG